MSKLVFLSDIKNFLSIDSSDNSYDGILTLLNELISAEVERYIGTKSLIFAQYEEEVSGTNRNYLCSSAFPVIEVEYAKDENGDLIEFLVEKKYGIFRIKGDLIWQAEKIFKLKYTAGYQFDESQSTNEVPKSIQFVVLRALGRYWNIYKSQGWGLNERRVAGGDSILIQDSNILNDEEKKILDQFRRILI